MRSRCLFLLLVGLAVACMPCPGAAHADSWAPYGRKLVADPTGRFYVVLTGGFDGASFTFVEARAGSPRVESSGTEGYDEPEGSGVRKGDSVLAKGNLESAPLHVRVSSKGAGFAALAAYGGVGSGTAFAWVTRDGKVQHVKHMHDLFSKRVIQAFMHTVSNIWWYRDAWIDEQRREVVVVGAGDGGIVKVVSLADGRVRAGGEAEFRRALRGTDPAAQGVALDLAIERQLEGLDDSMRGLLEDNTASLGVRLRAAVLLARKGDRSGATLVLSTVEDAKDGAVAKADFQYAVAHLGEVVGHAALPTLQKLMRGTAGDAWSAAQTAFVSLGAASVKTLVAMLQETGETPDYRGGAAHALSKIGATSAVPALLAAVADPDEYVANAALNAVIATAGADVSEALAALLDRRTTQDGRLASYFEEVKEAASIEPLVRCLARHPDEPYPRDVVLDALRFQTDMNFGDSPAAWERWLKKRR